MNKTKFISLSVREEVFERMKNIRSEINLQREANKSWSNFLWEVCNELLQQDLKPTWTTQTRAKRKEYFKPAPKKKVERRSTRRHGTIQRPPHDNWHWEAPEGLR